MVEANHNFNVALNSILEIVKTACLYMTVSCGTVNAKISTDSMLLGRKALRRLCNLLNRTHRRYINLICNDLPV